MGRDSIGMTMTKHYKALDGQVFGYEEDGTQDNLIAEAVNNGWQEMTTEEARAYIESLQPKAVPQIVSKAQAVLALSRANIWPAFDEYLNSDDAPAEHKLAWANINEVHRDSQMLAEIAVVLGLTDTDIDDLFIAASQIKV